MRRGAYFFVLDAFIAGIIIISSLAVVLSSFNITENPNQNYVLAEDLLTFLTTTTIVGYDSDVVYSLQQSGAITNEHNTLLQQIVVFYQQGTLLDYLNIEAMLEEVAEQVPANAGINFTIIDGGTEVELYSKDSPVTSQRSSLSARRVINAPGDTLPYIVEVQLWR